MLALLLSASPTLAGDQAAPSLTGDPMIKITSLPMKGDLSRIMAKISADVSRETGFAEKEVTCYWQTFDAIYCPGCRGAGLKKPIYVDIYIPAFVSAKQQKQLMVSLAEALARHTDYATQEVFIAVQALQKEQVYIMGNVVTNWKQVGGPDM
ncbi:hypothetical protein AAU61_10950 [Desulfocarbo indianensis]|nr:hypothetical protein AAU61_10950 [Desulfocarbo indianensis]